MDMQALREKPFSLNEKELAWVADTLRAMAEREKCGQLFVVLGNACTEEDLRDLIENWGVGGVLFRPAPHDIVAEQYRKADSWSKLPLLHAANLEEGGAGALSDGTYFGNAMQVAAANDLSCTESYAKCCAKEGRGVGINWSFSPVADIDYNFRNPITNVRTFGSDPERVLAHASVFVKTLQKHGIAASCKHFPGDGVDFRDQHLHPTYNSLSAEEWFASYGKIYKSLIDDGLLSVMAGHIVQPNVIRAIHPEATDAELLPGSQSKELLTGVLRERFGFNGVIITDATIMGGYTMTMKRRDAIPRSVMAGADMLCFGTDIREDIGYLMDALSDGRLSVDRLNDAVARVLAMKAVLHRQYPEAEIDCAAEEKRCAEKSVTLVKDTQSLIPVTKEQYPNIRLVTLGNSQAYDGSLTETAAELLEANGFHVERYDPLADDLHGTKDLPGDRLTLILCNYPTASNQTTVRIHWCEKHAMEIPRFLNEEAVAFISFSNPYHLQDVPRVRTYINAYSATQAVISAVIEKLLGKQLFKGANPVDPFCGLADTHD